LVFWGYPGDPLSAVVGQGYSGRKIENVSAHFAHVNVAKCSMNNINKGQAKFQVHEKCGYSFLLKEIEILMPEVIVSQGKNANKILSKLFELPGIEDSLPAVEKVCIGQSHSLWLPMDHPSHHLGEIRKRWPFYAESVRKWISENSTDSIHAGPDENSQSGHLEIEPKYSAPEVTTKSFNEALTVDTVIGKLESSDLGLHKSEVREKMVMGFEKENYKREKHAGKSVEWKEVR
jgi:hypothetical protein